MYLTRLSLQNGNTTEKNRWYPTVCKTVGKVRRDAFPCLCEVDHLFSGVEDTALAPKTRVRLESDDLLNGKGNHNAAADRFND